MAKKEILILNLVDDLSDSMLNYFKESSINLVVRSEVQDIAELGYIIVSNEEEAGAISKEYNTLKNDIKVICYSDVKEMKNYLLVNGRLVIGPNFSEEELGKFILNKFFNQNYNIHLDESFGSSLESIKDFKVTNHLAIGHVTDQLAVDAFEQGFNLVSIRSFVDHIIYYFTYLKQVGKASVPFEFEYGHSEDYFAINVHAPVKEFVAEYLIDSFGDVNSKDPLKYLLGVVSRSCDFLDVTYIEDPSRVAFTAFFAKQNVKKISGLSFNNVLTTAQVLTQLDKKIKDFVPEEQSSIELAKKQSKMQDEPLPGGFFDVLATPHPDSILSKDVSKTKEITTFAAEMFEQKFPDTELGEFSVASLDELLSDFPDQEFIQNLTEDDKNHLIDRVQNKNIVEAHEKDIAKAREELLEDDDFVREINDSITTELTNKVVAKLDSNILNNILSSSPLPVFDGGDPFATPMQAAERISEQVFDKIENPAEAQAIAIDMAKKAVDTYIDQEQLKDFTNNLADKFTASFPDVSASQLEVFKNVLETQALGTEKVSSEAPKIKDLPIFGNDDPFATAGGEFIEPNVAAESIAKKTAEAFSSPQELMDFTANAVAEASAQYTNPEQVQDFANLLMSNLAPNLSSLPDVQMDAFQEQVQDIATGNAAKNVLPPMPGIPVFTEDDPFAFTAEAFAEPAKAAVELADRAAEDFSTPTEMQSFALNIALQAQGQFSTPEQVDDFANSLADQFADQFENDEQRGAFAESVAALTNGVGGNLPEMSDDPFAVAPSFATPEKEDDAVVISGLVGSDESAVTVTGSNEDPESVINVSGSPTEAEGFTNVKGGKEDADDFMQKISGMAVDKDKNFSTSFSNAFDDDSKGQFNLKSLSTEDRKSKMNIMVKSTLDNAPGLKDTDLKVKAYVNKLAPGKIDAALNDFALNLDSSIDDLTAEQFSEFKETTLPTVLSALVEDEESIMAFKSELEDVNNSIQVISGGNGDNNDFQLKLKQRLEDKMSKLDDVEKVSGNFVVADNQLNDDKMQQVIKDTMKETFEEGVKFSSDNPEARDAKEKILIKNLSSSLEMDEGDVAQIVKGASDKAKELEQQAITQKMNTSSGQDTKAEAELISKLKQTEIENQKLKAQVQALSIQADASKATADQVQKVSELSQVNDKEVQVSLQNSETSGDSPISLEPTMSSGEREKLLKTLGDGRTLSRMELEKLQRALSQEQASIAKAKNAETSARRAEIENQKLEENFKSELARSNKILKVKDTVLEKAKESMKNIAAKKDREMSELKKQVNMLNQQLTSDKSTVLSAQLKSVLGDKEQLERQTEVYKNKLESMSKSIDENKKTDNSAVLTEENRALKGVKNQLENKLNAEMRSKRSIEERFQKAKSFETKASSELVSLKSALKSAEGQTRMLQTKNEQLLKNTSQLKASTGGVSGKEFGLLKDRNAKLHEKVSFLNAKLAEATKVKAPDPVAINTAELQKKTIELDKTVKEVDTLKEKNTKLQEMIEKLKSENDHMVVKDVDPAKVAEVQAAKDDKAEAAADKELAQLKTQNEELQAKIQAMAVKLKKASEVPEKKEEDKSPAEQRLEQSVKSMSQELTKAKTVAADFKKESMQASKEVTGLKNKLAQMKKALERSEALAKKAGAAKKKAA